MGNLTADTWSRWRALVVGEASIALCFSDGGGKTEEAQGEEDGRQQCKRENLTTECGERRPLIDCQLQSTHRVGDRE